MAEKEKFERGKTHKLLTISEIVGVIVIIVVLSLVFTKVINADMGNGYPDYPQITEQICGSCDPCPEGLECFNFPGIGSRCAKPNPCSYYQCPPNTECVFSGPPEIMIYCPDGTHGGGIAHVRCQCVGPECPATSGDEDTASYDLLTQTVVHTIDSDEQTVSHDISLWKTTDENRGILETPITSAEYRGKIVIKESKLFMDMSTGKEEPINFLPEDAIKKAKDVAETPEIIKVELKAEDEKPIYSIKGTKKAKILFLIPVTLEIETKIDATTGNIESVKKPWWSFLAW